MARSQVRDVKRTIRVALGALLALNVIAAGLLLFPPGGSADDLERQLATLQTQVAQKRALLERTRLNVTAIEKARGEGDQFLDNYFLTRRTADSALLSELTEAAIKAQIKERDRAQTTEFIEGSDTLSMMTITANYEGTYRNLLNFIGELDRSGQLLIIESMSAAPQQGSNTLTVSMKIDAFIRDDSGVSARETAQTARVEESR
ncbi:MAG: Fimbrial assembly family protein [Bryobacterales bacterium]|nr:Fimbrial assembly family protein [Bryobacterales bacterium]